VGAKKSRLIAVAISNISGSLVEMRNTANGASGLYGILRNCIAFETVQLNTRSGGSLRTRWSGNVESPRHGLSSWSRTGRDAIALSDYELLNAIGAKVWCLPKKHLNLIKRAWRWRGSWGEGRAPGPARSAEGGPVIDVGDT
jgi:hypothetical protein